MEANYSQSSSYSSSGSSTLSGKNASMLAGLPALVPQFQSPPTQDLNFSTILYYLQSEWRRFERERSEWDYERADLKSRLAVLESDKRANESVRQDLIRRIKMLEYALRKEREKYAALLRGDDSDRLATESTPNDPEKLVAASPKPRRAPSSWGSTLAPTDQVSGLSRPLLDVHRQAGSSESLGSVNSATSSGAVRKSNKTAKTREILKSYLQEIGYYSPTATFVQGEDNMRSGTGASATEAPSSQNVVVPTSPSGGVIPVLVRRHTEGNVAPSLGDSSSNSAPATSTRSAGSRAMGHVRSRGFSLSNKERGQQLEKNLNAVLGVEKRWDDFREEAETDSDEEPESEAKPSESTSADASNTQNEEVELVAGDIDTKEDTDENEKEKIAAMVTGMLNKVLEAVSNSSLSQENESSPQSISVGQDSANIQTTDGEQLGNKFSEPHHEKSEDGSNSSIPTSLKLMWDSSDGDKFSTVRTASKVESLPVEQPTSSRDGSFSSTLTSSSSTSSNSSISSAGIQGKSRKLPGIGKVDLDELANLNVNTESEAKPIEQVKAATDEAKHWKPKLTLRSHFDSVRAVAFHPLESYVFSASEDATIKYWNVRVGGSPSKKASSHDFEPIQTLRGHTAPVNCITVSLDGSRLFSASEDFTVRIWKVPEDSADLYGNYTWKYQGAALVGHSDAVWNVTLHPFRHILASASADCLVKIWDVGQGVLSGSLKASIKYPGILRDSDSPAPTWTAFPSSDLGKILISYTNARLALVDLETEKLVMWLENDEVSSRDSQINQVVAHPLMATCVTAHEDRSIKFFDLNTGKCLHSMVAHLEAVSCLDIAPSGNNIISGGHDASVRVWDFATKTCIQEFSSHRKKYDEAIHGISFHPLGDLLATAGADSTVKIYA